MANTVPMPSRLEKRALMPFFADHRKRTFVRGHFTRTSDAADTPQHAAILDRSSAALLRGEANQTLTTDGLMLVGVMLRLKAPGMLDEYPKLTAFVAQLAVSAGKPATG